MDNGRQLKYLIIGAGGTGGTVGAYLCRAGKDVALIARGRHLQTIKEKGLRVVRPNDEFVLSDIKAFCMEEYQEHPDVIFVCVKGYSLDEVVPFVRKVSGKDTIVIPILNIYGTGGELQKKLPGLLVTDGCIYVAAQIREPGCIWMKGDILRVIFGVRRPEEYRPVLEQIRDDLTESEILGVLSEHIRRDALLKFSYVSPQGACGLYYNAAAGEIQKPGEIRECFCRLVREIDTLALAMGIQFEENIEKRNLVILDDLNPTMTTSLQRDIAEGKKSEIDGLIFSVVRMGEKYQVELPEYRKIAEELKRRGL